MSLHEQTLLAQGSRRLTLTMMAVRQQADRFEGVAQADARPLRFLAAFQEAEPYLGLPPQAFKLVAWLMKMTKGLDWEAGSRPIAWPSAERQAEFLGLSLPRVKILNRLLYEAGIFVMRDSPTGKRYGRRAPDGRIVEAYGFDLSPLAYRYDEFVRLAAEARAERDCIRGLKKRATCARRAIAQTGETLAALGPLPFEWPQLAAETAELVAAIRHARSSDDMALIVKGLETRKAQAETLARNALKPVDMNPEGLVDEPHIISTNPALYPSDTVMAAEESSRGEDGSQIPDVGTQGKEQGKGDTVSDPFETQAKVYPEELLKLAPRLKDHVPQLAPEWADIIEAARSGLRPELGVSESLWGEACLAIGRPMAAIALAIVSTKPREHFTRGAGGYFAAMVKRAKTGELHLDRTLWKLRRDRMDRIERETSCLPKSRDHAWH